MLPVKRMRYVFGCAAAIMVAPGGFMPAQYRDGALPQIPIQAVGGGEVFVELSVNSSGVVSGVRTLRATAPFAAAVNEAVRGWQFRSAEEEIASEAGRPVELQTRKPVESTVLVAGIFRPPTLNTPTLGEPPRNVASASNETPFPLTTVMPRYPPLARDSGIVLVEARVDAGGGVADVKVIRSARPFDEPALDAARRWTFRPARVRGTAVPTLAYIAFAFRQPVTVLPGKRPE
ncbi:MAG TPA: energy transducer TonB [Vicinamibacterales bacterium]|jgi:TonB family protein|nr:energy transducer TonB [Vicinamibacterales bacterium]